MSDVMTKTPLDVLDYDVDFSRWLSAGDRIVSAATTIDSSAALIDRTDFSDTVAKIWISGGTNGENGFVSVKISTLQGRTKQFCFNLKIRECR